MIGPAYDYKDWLDYLEAPPTPSPLKAVFLALIKCLVLVTLYMLTLFVKLYFEF